MFFYKKKWFPLNIRLLQFKFSSTFCITVRSIWIGSVIAVKVGSALLQSYVFVTAVKTHMSTIRKHNGKHHHCVRKKLTKEIESEKKEFPLTFSSGVDLRLHSANVNDWVKVCHSSRKHIWKIIAIIIKFNKSTVKLFPSR